MCRELKASSAVQKISDYKAKEKAKMDVSCIVCCVDIEYSIGNS